MNLNWNLLINKTRSLFGSKPAHSNPILAPHFDALENRLSGALGFLRNNFITQNGQKILLNSLPWFVIIGNSNTGKTTMLANSHIKYVLDKKFKRDQPMLPSDTCDWWVTQNTVLIDIPGKYFTVKPNKVSLSNKLWDHFLFLLQKTRGPHGVNGVVVTLSLSEIVDRENLASLIDVVKMRISELQHQFGMDLPIYFTITKCDLMPGFVEFFSEYSKEELLQAWGVPIQLNNEVNIVDTFIRRFNVLIKRLNEQMISRLHQERNMHAKYFIKDFPLQLERLKETFAEFLRKLTEKNCYLHLQGVYLNSALQQESEIEQSEQKEILVANHFHQALAILKPPTMPTQAYFIKQFLLNCLMPRIPSVNKYQQKKQISYAVAAVIAVFVAIYVGHFFISPAVKPVLLADDTQHATKKQSIYDDSIKS